MPLLRKRARPQVRPHESIGMLDVLFDQRILTYPLCFSSGVPTFVYVSVASIVPSSVSGIVGGTDFKVRIFRHMPISSLHHVCDLPHSPLQTDVLEKWLCARQIGKIQDHHRDASIGLKQSLNFAEARERGCGGRILILLRMITIGL